MTRRLDRINVLLRQEISHLLAMEMRDPRLSSVVSVTRVGTSGDLQHAKVFISVLGDREAKEHTLEALKSASGFLRKELRQRLSLRQVPELRFYLDDSIEKSSHLMKVMKEASPEPNSQE